MTIEPDTKDWTWVLDTPCPECGYAAADLEPSGFGALVRANAATWAEVLRRPDAGVRPDPTTWSATEYAAHVRDVHRVFGGRLSSMLEQDQPTFPDWDQDATALAERYDLADPDAVARDLAQAAEAVATTYDAIRTDQLGRRGLRSNGSEFIVESLGRYHLHDVVHHAWDVREAAKRATIAAYDENAADYSRNAPSLPPHLVAWMEDLAARLGKGARVLEIGSGSGRDALALEALGLEVRRTDVTPAFVAALRAAGHDADLLDPLDDDLAHPGDGAPYDAVWANACLLHVARADLPVVLRRLAEVTRDGGELGASVKEGDGDVWSVHGSVSAPRQFVLWREAPLRRALEDAGWDVDHVGHRTGIRDTPWLEVRAVRRRVL